MKLSEQEKSLINEAIIFSIENEEFADNLNKAIFPFTSNYQK